MNNANTVFDFVNQILHGNSKGKQIELSDENLELYNKYVINKALSFHHDCLFQANAMNLYSNIDERMHYSFLLNTIRKYKRTFKPWIKPEYSENVELIRKFFNVSKREAIEIEGLVCEEDLNKIKQELDIGGIKNEHSK
jgi:hypothetical protein